MSTAKSVSDSLRALASEERALASRRFFKTGPGESAEGDQFIGVKVPEQRLVVREYRGIALPEILKLLKSEIHEERLTALLLMVDLYRRSKKDEEKQGEIVAAYLKHLHYVNGWDLVDSSSPQILGNWLLPRDRAVLYELVKSPHLWMRRTGILATHELIKNGESEDALALAALLLGDQEDLMHKACGWMLREVGEKVGLGDLRGFLKLHAERMPRTMLRYSIEKLPPSEKKRWMGR